IVHMQRCMKDEFDSSMFKLYVLEVQQFTFVNKLFYVSFFGIHVCFCASIIVFDSIFCSLLKLLFHYHYAFVFFPGLFVQFYFPVFQEPINLLVEIEVPVLYLFAFLKGKILNSFTSTGSWQLPFPVLVSSIMHDNLHMHFYSQLIACFIVSLFEKN
ncbi:hypothetical protein ACJX0J_009749, partial [Zea mays]